MSGTLFVIGEIVLYLAAATVIGLLLGRLTARAGARSSARQVASLRQQTATLEAEVERLDGALTTARADAARAADAGDLEVRAAMAEREAEGLARRLRDVSEVVEALTSERDELIERLASPPDADETSVDTLDERLGEAEERIAALQAERDALAERLEAAARAAAVERDGESDPPMLNDEELSALRSELEHRRAQIARLEQAAAAAARLERELAVRNDRIGDLEARLEATSASRSLDELDAASIGVSMGAGNYADSRLEFDAWDAADS